ncbi:endonuclease/exonuclease/phosphatase family protein [Pseudoflavitalea sp. G-6-1-2]|uniref:endonuclease/exonuclease/phosphatase family protein n=1 Tax=Pseudoflavitalea sp. G-6-1-2 TaxID=2728841 RepID=UPI00146DE26F|nr:endonuclease/exonuclease/phosphatase family protein [Pseudoflavitalea sp. G-6-1-2]NML22324.1 endonuclease/exonuclease/phosphatase family protein [Pseudoflavitalea sp. G-6-1-2]
MKRITAIATLLILLSTALQAQQIRIASYNLRFDNPRDSGNLWVNRQPVISALIRFHNFDIFGTQEGLRHQLDTLGASLKAYTWYGLGRDDGKSAGEHSAIFWKKEKYTLLGKGDFWLSETPEKPGPGWDAKLNRICTWVQLQDVKSKKKFFVFNVHFDHQGVKAREESGSLILQKIKTIAGNAAVMLTGDFNGDQKSGWYLNIANSKTLRDTYRDVKEPYENNASFNGFGRQSDANGIIDHIFVTKHFTVQRWGVLTDTYHGKFPSDHFPVMADVTLK